MAALSAGSAPAYNPVTAAALHQSLLDSTVNNAPKILEGLFVRPSWIREKAAELRRTRSEGDRVSLPPRPLDTVSAAQPPFLQAVDLSTTYVPVANSKRAFRLVQEHWPGDACLFVGK